MDLIRTIRTNEDTFAATGDKFVTLSIERRNLGRAAVEMHVPPFLGGRLTSVNNGMKALKTTPSVTVLRRNQVGLRVEGAVKYQCQMSDL